MININDLFILVSYVDVIVVIIIHAPEPIWSSNQRQTQNWQESAKTATENLRKKSAREKHSSKHNNNSNRFSNNKQRQQRLNRSLNLKLKLHILIRLLLDNSVTLHDHMLVSGKNLLILLINFQRCNLLQFPS